MFFWLILSTSISVKRQFLNLQIPNQLIRPQSSFLMTEKIPAFLCLANPLTSLECFCRPSRHSVCPSRESDQHYVLLLAHDLVSSISFPTSSLFDSSFYSERPARLQIRAKRDGGAALLRSGQPLFQGLFPFLYWNPFFSHRNRSNCLKCNVL